MSALSDQRFDLQNLSDAKDTQTMQKLLGDPSLHWDVQEAGTTMRFCTAYLALKGNGHTITGTERMKQRPIGILAEALQNLGATIHYLEKPGYPPMKIDHLTVQKTDTLSVPGNVSSQFISALLMIAPTLPHGLNLTLTDDIFSRPYIEMTLGLMSHFGVDHEWNGNTISIDPQPYQSRSYHVESDWSGASYWYAIAAIAAEAKIKLQGLRRDSLQGDQAIVQIMENFGIQSQFDATGVQLVKTDRVEEKVKIDFKTCPDLAQGVMVAAAVKGIRLEMTGLETLRIKETDRIHAMKQELHKINAVLTEHDDGASWTLVPGTLDFSTPTIETYEDHRMAMAFGPASLVTDLHVQDEMVVKKSYPGYWEDLKSVGVKMAKA